MVADGMASIDFDAISFTEMVQLQNQISVELRRRFEKKLGLAFSDVVGSTAYFARFGDEAGRGMQQRHTDLLKQAIAAHEGRIVDVAGDGAFTAFPTAEATARGMVTLLELISQQNTTTAREHQLAVRVGVHYGPVLTDGVLVSGDSVNLCSKGSGTGAGGEIRLTRQAFLELEKESRLRCVGLPSVTIKGMLEPVELLQMEWRDQSRYPSRVRIRETTEIIILPSQDVITFGRLRDQNGIAANDIVLALPYNIQSQQISRWQFELRRRHDGFILRAVSDQLTEVDGTAVPKNSEVPIKPGSVVRVAGVMTLEFQGEPSRDPTGGSLAGATVYNMTVK